MRCLSDGSEESQLPYASSLPLTLQGPMDSLVIQADGKLLLSMCAVNGTTYQGVIFRLRTDGTLDDTFGPEDAASNGSGYVLADGSGTMSACAFKALTVDSEGGILAIGESLGASTTFDSLWRFCPDVPVVTPTIDSIELANDTGIPGCTEDEITKDPTIRGHAIIPSESIRYVHVMISVFDAGGCCAASSSVAVASDGSFSFTPQQLSIGSERRATFHVDARVIISNSDIGINISGPQYSTTSESTFGFAFTLVDPAFYGSPRTVPVRRSRLGAEDSPFSGWRLFPSAARRSWQPIRRLSEPWHSGQVRHPRR